MDQGNPASPGDSTSPPDAFFSYVSSAMLTSPTPPNAGSTTTSPSSSKMYLLTYNATIWAHEDTTDKITFLDGTPITVDPSEYISPATLQPVGVLGIYFSEAKARRTGKAWLYDQLMGLGEEVYLPLPTQDGSECTEPDWRKSGWQRMADGSWAYSISDYSPRMLALVVHVTEKSVIADDDDDVKEEYWDSDDDFGKQRYKLVGPVGSRKRVVRTDEDEDDEEEEGEDEEDDESEETETGIRMPMLVRVTATLKRLGTGMRKVRGTIWTWLSTRISVAVTETLAIRATRRARRTMGPRRRWKNSK